MTDRPDDFLAYVRVLWSDGVATEATGVLIGFNDVLVPTAVFSRGGGVKAGVVFVHFGGPLGDGYGFNHGLTSARIDNLTGDAFAVIGIDDDFTNIGSHAAIAGVLNPARASYGLAAEALNEKVPAVPSSGLADMVVGTIPGDAADGADGWTVSVSGELVSTVTDTDIHRVKLQGAAAWYLDESGEAVIAGLGLNDLPAGATGPLRIQPLAPLHDEIIAVTRANDMLIEGGNTRVPVYRFLNTENGAHFYTADSVERNTVDQTLDSFVYEGIAFGQPEEPGIEVYRFFNTIEGGHFFTTSAIERDHVIGTLPQYRFEGIGFQSAGEGAGAVAVHRFYDTATGGHFFTGDDAEKEAVIAGLPQYRYEGIGFWMNGI